MGLSLVFMIGDTGEILGAIERAEFSSLSNPGIVEETADMSLHIVPRDLDALSEEFAVESHQQPMKLRPNLARLCDTQGRGVLEVGEPWVGYVAAVPIEAACNITERWIAKMAKEYNQQLKVTDGAIKSVERLINLCKRSRVEKRKVLHVWYL